MKISKHSHSCLLIEENSKRILIDPGVYTEEDSSLSLDQLSSLEYILLTHNHSDHLSVSLIKKLVGKFPQVTIITNYEGIETLEKDDIKATNSSTSDITMIPAIHEKFLTQVIPAENTLFTLFNRLTHPGDSFDFTTSSEILALPITAPWGSTTKAVEKALEVRPKIIIPIHDWHWKDAARQQFYSVLQGIFAKEGIDFKPLENNEMIEV